MHDHKIRCSSSTGFFDQLLCVQYLYIRFVLLQNRICIGTFSICQQVKQVINLCYQNGRSFCRLYLFSFRNTLSIKNQETETDAIQLQRHTDMWFNYGIIDLQIDSSGALNMLQLTVKYTDNNKPNSLMYIVIVGTLLHEHPGLMLFGPFRGFCSITFQVQDVIKLGV